MGTNFYLKHIVTEEDIQKLHKLVDERRFTSEWDHEDDPYDSVQNVINLITDEIHICKRSGGWHICFDHNWGKYWQPSRKSLEEWTRKPGFKIIDEYGTEFTAEQFWKEMDDWEADIGTGWGTDLLDSEKYQKVREAKGERREYLCTEDIEKVERLFGIKTRYNDFTVDNLRFAVYSDFS